MLNRLITFCEFIRLKICVFAAFMTASGYLLFNEPSLRLLLFSLSSFFVCAGAYSFNNMSDKKEDAINRRKTADAFLNKTGMFASFLLSAAGVLISATISSYAFSLSAAFVFIGIIYSSLRIKEYTLLKNIYTGFVMSLLFLLGAMRLDYLVVEHYLLISLFFLTGSIISDLRDYEGDKFADIKTLPVRLGYESAKRIAYVLLVTVFILTYQLNMYKLFPFFIVISLVFYYLWRNKPETAHSVGGLFSPILVVWMVFVS